MSLLYFFETSLEYRGMTSKQLYQLWLKHAEAAFKLYDQGIMKYAFKVGRLKILTTFVEYTSRHLQSGRLYHFTPKDNLKSIHRVWNKRFVLLVEGLYNCISKLKSCCNIYLVHFFISLSNHLTRESFDRWESHVSLERSVGYNNFIKPKTFTGQTDWNRMLFKSHDKAVSCHFYKNSDTEWKFNLYQQVNLYHSNMTSIKQDTLREVDMKNS